MKKWYTLYALFVLFRRLGQKMEPFHHFSNIALTFSGHFRFLYILQIGCHEFFQEGSHDYYTTTQREESSVFNTIEVLYLQFLSHFVTVH